MIIFCSFPDNCCIKSRLLKKKISDGENPLDNTSIHPESYEATTKLLGLCNLSTTLINEKGNLVELFVKSKYSV